MTRINCILPSELCRHHLIAEYRELPRVFALAALWYRDPCKTALPRQYTLGKGHVRFFYDKLLYLQKRHEALVREMKNRGYHPAFDAPVQTQCPSWMMNDWNPDEQAMVLNRTRIAERLASMEGSA